ncbi:MAG: hypothetical protein AB7S93_13410 [Xanthobacteraceae bacterium]
MPLPNRVDPFGQLFADAARGLFMGNRGGRFHRDDRTLGAGRFVSRQWICCRLEFKDRHRDVWGASYTELFFLDEPTALAAGHRPCFECRREDAQAFAAAFSRGSHVRSPPRADEMDRILHAERLEGRRKRRHSMPIDELPDATFVTLSAEPAVAYAVKGARLLAWTPRGYGDAGPRPAGIVVDVLTPPAIVAAFLAGYRPQWHDSAGG